MHTLLKKIQLGIGAGAALALSGGACASSLTHDIDASEASQSHSDARVIDAASDAQDAGRKPDAMLTDASDELPPFPNHLITCEQIDDGGLCCRHLSCFAVEGTCPAVDAPDSPVAGVIPHPSDAHCGYTNLGPFQAPDPPPPWDAGWTCCYVLPGEGLITGRPMLCDQTPLVAPVIERSDWLLA